MAKKEKENPAVANRSTASFINFKKHSDCLDDYFVDGEPSNRVSADTDNPNKADKAFKQMVEGNVMPNRKNGGVKSQINRRNK